MRCVFVVGRIAGEGLGDGAGDDLGARRSPVLWLLCWIPEAHIPPAGFGLCAAVDEETVAAGRRGAGFRGWW